jgi:hypothetical protein
VIYTIGSGSWLDIDDYLPVAGWPLVQVASFAGFIHEGISLGGRGDANIAVTLTVTLDAAASGAVLRVIRYPYVGVEVTVLVEIPLEDLVNVVDFAFDYTDPGEGGAISFEINDLGTATQAEFSEPTCVLTLLDDRVAPADLFQQQWQNSVDDWTDTAPPFVMPVVGDLHAEYVYYRLNRSWDPSPIRSGDTLQAAVVWELTEAPGTDLYFVLYEDTDILNGPGVALYSQQIYSLAAPGELSGAVLVDVTLDSQLAGIYAAVHVDVSQASDPPPSGFGSWGVLTITPGGEIPEPEPEEGEVVPKMRGMVQMLPRKIRATEAWADYANAIDFLVTNQILEPSGKIVTLRDPDNLELALLTRLSQLLGFALRADSYTEAEQRFIVRSLYQYYAANGTPSFENFLSILARYPLKLNALWTTDYEVFERDAPPGGNVYAGNGPGHLTPHFEIYLRGEDSYTLVDSDFTGALGLENSGLGELALGVYDAGTIAHQSVISEDLIEAVFYDLAPVHLVLERIVRGYTAEGSLVIGGDVQERMFTGRSYAELTPMVGALDASVALEDVGPLELAGYLSNIYPTDVEVRWRTAVGSLSSPSAYLGVAEAVVLVPAGQRSFPIPVQIYEAAPPGHFYVEILEPGEAEPLQTYTVWRRFATVTITGELTVNPDEYVSITGNIATGICIVDSVEDAGPYALMGLQIEPSGALSYVTEDDVVVAGTWKTAPEANPVNYEARFTGAATGVGTAAPGVWLGLEQQRAWYNNETTLDPVAAVWIEGLLEIRNAATGVVVASSPVRAVNARTPETGYCDTWPDVPPEPPALGTALSIVIPADTIHLPAFGAQNVTVPFTLAGGDEDYPYAATAAVLANPARGVAGIVSCSTTQVVISVQRLSYGPEAASGTVRVTATRGAETVHADVTVLSPAAEAPGPGEPGGPGPGPIWDPDEQNPQ